MISKVWRRGGTLAWLALVFSAVMSCVPVRASAQVAASAFERWGQKRERYGQTIHTGFIANPGLVRYSGSQVSLDGSDKRWVVYHDSMRVTSLLEPGDCPNCIVVSGAEFCEIKALIQSFRNKMGSTRPPVLRSGAELIAALPRTLANLKPGYTYLISPDLVGLTEDNPNSAVATQLILAAFHFPAATVEQYAGENAPCPAFRSGLYDPESGTVAHKTDAGTIGYEAAWFSRKPDASGDSCKPPPDDPDPIAAVPNALRRFAVCNPSWLVSSGIVWGPLSATLDLVSLPESTIFGKTTRPDGYYSFVVNGLAGVDYTISGKMRFTPFTTRMKSTRTYWLGSWPGMISRVDLAYAFTNVGLNLTMVSGTFDITNPVGRVVPTVWEDEGDLSGIWPVGQTRYSLGGPSDTMPSGLLETISQADLRDTSVYVYRLSDGALLGSRWGLTNLEVGCSPEVESQFCDNKIMSSGSYQVLLRGYGANHRTNWMSSDCPSGSTDCQRVEMLQPALGVELDYSKAALETDTGLRPLDAFGVVVVNHATGYMGSLETTNKQGVNANATARVKNLILGPPNLKVWAERVPAGRTRPDGAPVSDVYRVGFEGSALTSDERLVIYTEWLDQEGKPLPAGLGMTGRLATSHRVTESASPGDGGVPSQTPTDMELAPVGEMLGEMQDEGGAPFNLGPGMFAIRPGLHMAVMRLPKTEHQQALHFYVHVDGADPTFQGPTLPPSPPPPEGPFPPAEPVAPDFDQNKVCYHSPVKGALSCIERDPTAPDILKERPWTHVPVLVPQYNRSVSESLAREAREAGLPAPAPVYGWVRRPEYHFSLLELDTLTIRRTTANNSTVLLPTSVPGDKGDGSELLESDKSLDITAVMFTSEADELLRFTGPKIFEWNLGDQWATMDAAGNAHFDNPGQVSATDMLALSLVQDKDEGNILWQHKYKSIDFHLEDGKTSVPVGKTTRAIATIEPEDEVVFWQILQADRGVQVKLSSTSGASVGLIVAPKSEGGDIVLEASTKAGSRGPAIRIAKKIMVGCECIPCSTPGDLRCELGSVDARWSVGFDKNGQPAGSVYLESDELGASLGTPSELKFSTLSEGVKAIYLDGGVRQVVGASSFVDVVTLSPTSYRVVFYDPEAQGAKLANLTYAVKPGSQPVSSWIVSGGAAGLQIVGNKGAEQKLYQYSRDGNGVWSLGKGRDSVVERETLDEQPAGADRVERRRLLDAAGNVASDTERTYRTYGWGEALVLEVQDPEGAARVTSYAYGSSGNALGQLTSVQYPDGSWVSYAYSDEGRIESQSGPWLDSPITDPGNARTTSWSYTPVDPREEAPGTVGTPVGGEGTQRPRDGDDGDMPRTVIERIAGVETSRTYYAFFRTLGNSRVEIVERAATPGANYGAAGNQRTTTIYEPQTAARREQRRLRSVQYSDGRLDSFENTRGTWTSGVFTPGEGKAHRQTVTHGTAQQPAGVSGKSTREVRIEDGRGNVVREESWANVGGSYTQLSWTNNTYDKNNRLTRSRRSNGTETSATWGCCGYDTQTDEQGITTTYSYDALGRVETETRQGVTTTHIYDAAGREKETRRSSSSGTLISSRVYDAGGRVQSSTDESGLVTSYAYSSDGRVTTVTRPGGITEVTQSYADGRTISVTGSGVVAQYSSYAVNADGTQVTEQRAGSAGSPLFERSVTDMLGRTVRTERPGYNGVLEVSQSVYDAQGKLVRQTSPGMAATLFSYDALGNQQRTGLDVNANTVLDVAGTDRVQETDTQFVSRSGAVWQETVQRVYATDGSSTPTTVSTQRSRLSGFTPGVIAESESVDLYGNVTTSRTLLNAEGATVTQLVDTPDSDSNQVTISVQGRVIATTSATGLTTSYGYDGFGRRTSVTDGRTGTSTTHYDGAGRVDYVEDAQARRTSFGYEPSTGRKLSETNALGKVTRFAYTTRGELWRTWGDVAYPVEYGYDSQGRRTTMRTYRQALAWNGAAWPEGASGDTTTWEYEPASGLLLAKRDASGAAVQYTYGAGGRLATRRWARSVSGSPLATSYGYVPGTGELDVVDYADGTPDVDFSYDRLGRMQQVTDGTGTHVMAYNPTTLGLVSETRTGLVPAVITQKTQTTGVPGRNQGFTLGSGYDVTYSYDTKGRMSSVGWNVSGQTDTATYARVPNSELLGGVTYGTGLATTYGYEPQRDLKTQVRNAFGGTTISQYDYQYDAIGRRTSVANSGSAFAAAAFNRWGYNDRNELTESGRYLGTNVENTSSPVAEEYRAYNFDPIGNRITATEGAEQKSYQANALNEYVTADGASLTYDADGNLTSDGTRRFVYDAENRLTLVEPLTPANGSVRVRMAYDYLGRRVQKVVEEYDGSAWAAQDDVRFVYMGWNVIEERRTSGGVSTRKNFVWGLDLSQSFDGAGGIGGLLAVVDEAGGQMAFLYDANGNVGQLVDEGGAVVARYEYDAFGQALVAAGAAAHDNPYRFSTKYADEETGLVYYGYRYYSVGLGRWTQRDVIGERGGLNLYGFVKNGPTDSVDLLGMKCVKEFSVGSRRAILRCDAGDSVKDITNVVAFDRREFSRWLRAEDRSALPKSETEKFCGKRKFSVPNTVYVVMGWLANAVEKAASWPTFVQAAGVAAGQPLAGRLAVYDDHLTESELRSYLGDADIYGLVYYGHGPSMTTYHDASMEEDDGVDVSPHSARQWVHHGLPALTHNGCNSLGHGAFACGFGFDALVTTAGIYSAQEELVSPYSLPFAAKSVPGTYSPAQEP